MRKLWIKIKDWFKRVWFKVKDLWKRFWRFVVPITVAAGVGAVILTSPITVLPEDLNQDIGCVVNANGDWVSYNLETGKHQSKVLSQDKLAVVEKVSTSTTLGPTEADYRYVGKKKDAPCVFFEGKSLKDYTTEEKNEKLGRKVSLIEKAYAAMSFPANTDQVNFGDNFDFLTSNTFTIEWWQKAVGTTDCEFLISKEKNTANIGSWAVFTFDCATAGEIAWKIGGGNAAQRTYCTFSRGGSALDDNVWHHVAIVQNNGSTCASVAGYADGVSRSLTQQDTGTASNDNVNAMTLGTPPFTPTGGAVVSLDELRIWNYARSADLVAGNMWLRIPDQEGLIGYWRLDEGNGSSTYPYASHASSSGVIGNVAGTSPFGTTWVDSAPINYPE